MNFWLGCFVSLDVIDSFFTTRHKNAFVCVLLLHLKRATFHNWPRKFSSFCSLVFFSFCICLLLLAFSHAIFGKRRRLRWNINVLSVQREGKKSWISRLKISLLFCWPKIVYVIFMAKNGLWSKFLSSFKKAKFEIMRRHWTRQFSTNSQLDFDSNKLSENIHTPFNSVPFHFLRLITLTFLSSSSL